MLQVQNLSVVVSGITLVDQVSFDLDAGQWLMIAGPNGAGKSTLINAITQGVPYTGSALLNGQDIATVRPRLLARKIGTLAQKNEVNYSFTVREIVSMGRYAYSAGVLGASTDADNQFVEEALEMTGLSSRREQSILTLSGGELQRVFIAQLFAQDPEILILDEPSNHLDIQYQMQLFHLIEDWCKEKNRAVISVVHDLSLARLYGSFAMLMDRGKAVACGDKEQVFDKTRLEQVYCMDVYAWMRKLGEPWAEQPL